MTTNQIFVRNLVGVATTIAIVTAGGMWLGAASRHAGRAMASPPPPPAVTRDPVQLGAQLFDKKGCTACHTIDGSARVGPSFKGAWGSDVVLADGITLRFDAQYVRESLAHPQAKARPGYPPSMPSYDGMLSEKEIDALVAFIESLR